MENTLLTAPGADERATQPLSELMRPNVIEEFYGQLHIREKIHALLESERIPSLLFYGPPGCGKSSLALIFAQASGRPYKRVSAPEVNLAQLRNIIGSAEILVLDEIHRFSKAQQDFFLPLIESGQITLLATTTENPSFSVTRQILSRMHVLRLRSLSMDELTEICIHTLERLGMELEADAIQLLCDAARGDGRGLLNLIEYVAGLPDEKHTLEGIRSILPEQVVNYDKNGDNHFDIISALIKSIRGSDPNASIYYLTCLIEGGEDPSFICRRLIISAAEDIGLADINALPVAVACQQAVEFVGAPECYLILAETVLYLAFAHKSNTAYTAFLNARKNIRSHGVQEVPLHLRNATTATQKEWGYGRDYKYPHNFAGGWVPQEYLPDTLVGEQFYYPSENGAEPRVIQWWRRNQKKALNAMNTMNPMTINMQH